MQYKVLGFRYLLRQFAYSGTFTILLLLNFSCSGGTGAGTTSGSTSSSASSPVPAVTVSPASPTTSAGGSIQFKAMINGTPTNAITWSASGGTISSDGMFTAPPVLSDTFVAITAASTANLDQKSVASVVITRSKTEPILAINMRENRYCGLGNVPRFPSATDGPAQLPLNCYYTGMDGTPSPGKTLAGNDPNALYAQASCGDVIVLTAGQSIIEEPEFPRKNCDDQHYITIRTSAPDAQLPPEGTRINPCYFGTAFLPGRPQFPECPSGGAQNLGFKITPKLGATPTFGDHIRFIGIEFAKPAGGLWTGFDLSGSDHIIFDRIWMHGNPGEDSSHGLVLRNTHNVAVINSYFSDFHCNSGPTGACTDGHPIGGGNNTEPGTYHGTLKIYGNFLEGSGQSLTFGGANSVDTSLDIDIEGNFLFKPLTWDPDDPSYDGGVNGHPYIVKNHFELKNAGRVLFRGNRLMNVWGGFSQNGASIVIYAVSQSGKCPLTCQVHDVTVAYNYVTNAQQAISVDNNGNGLGWFAFEGRNYSIHDLIADGLDFPTANTKTQFKVDLGTGPTAPASDILANVSLDHITLVEQGTSLGGFLAMSGPSPAAESGITWKNSVMPAGSYGVFSSGGTGNCANSPAITPTDKFDACWQQPYVFTKNLIVGGDSIGYPTWPAGNLTDTTTQSVVYVNFNGGALGDYHLAGSSPGKNAADDGTDMGANVDVILAEIAGIR
jgi:hypothetical protein